MKLKNSDFFYCYNKKLSDFIKDNGERYILTANNFKGKQFWMYQRNERLDELIEMYKIAK